MHWRDFQPLTQKQINGLTAFFSTPPSVFHCKGTLLFQFKPSNNNLIFSFYSCKYWGFRELQMLLKTFIEYHVPRLRQDLYIKISCYFQCLKFTLSKSKHMLRVTMSCKWCYSVPKKLLGPRGKVDSFQHVLCGLVSVLLAFGFLFLFFFFNGWVYFVKQNISSLSSNLWITFPGFSHRENFTSRGTGNSQKH